MKYSFKKGIKIALWVLLNIIFLGIPQLFLIINRRIRLTITFKTTMLFMLIFSVILVTVTVFLIANVENYFKIGNFAEENNNSFLARLKFAMAIFVPLFLFVALSLGLIASTSMLSPVRKMIGTLHEVSPKDMSLRLEPIDSQDELRALTDIVNDMLERLEENFNQQTEFVSNASHELRTPIAVVQGYSDLLRRWGKENPEILEEAITAISKEAQSMKNLVEKLLFLAKLGNRYQLNRSTFLLNELLEEIIGQARVIDSKHKFVLEKTNMIEINADYDLLKQAIRILLDNAVKYSPEGLPIEMGAMRKAKFSEQISGALPDYSINIFVRDYGAGISKQEQEQIFNRFYRCDKARARSEGSTGLGLSIAKQIVELHGGSIEVLSELGKGSEFTIIL